MFNQMASQKFWLFTKDQIDNSPSIKDGFKAQDEVIARQTTAFFIHDLGTKLKTFVSLHFSFSVPPVCARQN
jgi:hypothetical protein